MLRFSQRYLVYYLYYCIIFLQVNSNGIISFSGSFHQAWEPSPFPRYERVEGTQISIVAPFHADIDITRRVGNRNGGTITYKAYGSENAAILQRATNDIRNSLPHAYSFEARYVLVASWLKVMSFCDRSCTNAANSKVFLINIYNVISLRVDAVTQCMLIKSINQCVS